MPRGHDTLKFVTPRFTIYWVICEHLEMVDHITDTIECLQQMLSELADETDIYDDQERWILGKRLHKLFKATFMQLLSFRLHSVLW